MPLRDLGTYQDNDNGTLNALLIDTSNGTIYSTDGLSEPQAIDNNTTLRILTSNHYESAGLWAERALEKLYPKCKRDEFLMASSSKEQNDNIQNQAENADDYYNPHNETDFMRYLGHYDYNGTSGDAMIGTNSEFYLRDPSTGDTSTINDVLMSMVVANDGIEFEDDDVFDAVIDLLIHKREIATEIEKQNSMAGANLPAFNGENHKTTIDDILTTDGTIGTTQDNKWKIIAGNGAFYMENTDDEQSFRKIIPLIAPNINKLITGDGLILNDGTPQQIIVDIAHDGTEYGYKIAIQDMNTKTIWAALNLTEVTLDELLQDFRALAK